jgi:hypothetical protein
MGTGLNELASEYLRTDCRSSPGSPQLAVLTMIIKWCTRVKRGLTMRQGYQNG